MATASVLHAGKRIVHLEAQIRDEPAGHLVAVASGSFALVGGDSTTE